MEVVRCKVEWDMEVDMAEEAEEGDMEVEIPALALEVGEEVAAGEVRAERA